MKSGASRTVIVKTLLVGTMTWLLPLDGNLCKPYSVSKRPFLSPTRNSRPEGFGIARVEGTKQMPKTQAEMTVLLIRRTG
jgi:hypothetical protein